jgi:hypothetical protein
MLSKVLIYHRLNSISIVEYETKIFNKLYREQTLMGKQSRTIVNNIPALLDNSGCLGNWTAANSNNS